MSVSQLSSWTTLFTPHLIATALCAGRLLPVAFLCPMLGGASTPSHVKVGVALSLSLAIHFAGGATPLAAVADPWTFLALALKELALGTAIGLVASLPFDAARIGGRFIDLFRGSSAEAALPVSGTRESAAGDLLYQLLVALAVLGLGYPAVMGSLWRSFGLVRLGGQLPTESAAMHVVGLAGTSLATGLAVGAPIAGAVMAVDCALGMISRFAPQMNLQDAGAPLRILAGGAVLWLSVGWLSDRLLREVTSSAGALHALLEVG